MSVARDLKAVFLRQAADLVAQGHKPAQAVADYCSLTGVSRQAAYKLLAKNGITPPRKRRSDAGKSKVTDADVMAVAAFQQNSQRKSLHKRTLPMNVAKEQLTERGVITQASDATYHNRLHQLYLDERSRKRPEPFITLRSSAPNHVWQIDASQAAQWYLKDTKLSLDREREIAHFKVEKNFTGVLKRYIVGDHFSGAFWVFYSYAKGENARDFLRCLWEAMTYKGDNFPLCGIPEIIYSDSGSGLTAAATANAFRALGIRYIAHKPGNPRAKGFIETMQGLWEAGFEDLLLASGITGFTLDELNQYAFEYSKKWNAEKVMRRTRKTRFDLWNAYIDRNALRLPPEWEVFRRLAAPSTEVRTVRGDYIISYASKGHGSHLYSLRRLSQYPNCQPGSKVEFVPDAVDPRIITIKTDDDKLHRLTPIDLGADGRPIDAPLIGDEFKSQPDDLATTARKAAMAAEVPQGDLPQKVVSFAERKIEREMKAPKLISRLAWIDAYADEHDIERKLAASIFADRYGIDATEGIYADVGVVWHDETQGETDDTTKG